jgi:hypothetical protein
MENRQYEPVKYPFSDQEIRELGEALARENQVLIDLRDARTAQMAASNAAIKESLKLAAELTQKINNRYELREVEVIWMPDNPKPGTKALMRVDRPDIVVRYEPMTPAEMQGSLGFGVSFDPDEDHK